jgi:hypothetical protein
MTDHLKRSQRQERDWADDLDGRTTPGSGNTWARKNDVRSERWSLELKTTEKKQYSLKAADLRTAERNALMDGREFAFGIEMAGSTWVVMNAHDWHRMREAAGWS